MATLEPIADEVWSTTIPLRFWGVETGTRMTIVRLQSGGLFVHSPIPLVGDLPAEVGALGPVTAVVAPSLFHHMSVRPWKEAYRSTAARPGSTRSARTSRGTAC